MAEWGGTQDLFKTAWCLYQVKERIFIANIDTLENIYNFHDLINIIFLRVSFALDLLMLYIFIKIFLFFLCIRTGEWRAKINNKKDANVFSSFNSVYIFMFSCRRNAQVTCREAMQMKIISFHNYKHCFLIEPWSATWC